MVSGLRVKVMALFLLASLLPLGSIGLLSLHTANSAMTDMVLDQLENVANDKSALLEKWIAERKADLQELAGSSILRSMRASEIEPYLRLVAEKYRVYKGFVVATREGEVVLATFSYPYRNVQREKWFRYAVRGDVYLSSDIHRPPDGKDSAFLVAAPVAGEGGAVSECYLVNREGVFLAHKDPRRILRESIAKSGSFRSLSSKESREEVYTDYRGVKVLGTYGTYPARTGILWWNRTVMRRLRVWTG